VLLGVRTGTNGKRFYAMTYFFGADMTEDEVLDTIINKTTFTYNAGRKVYGVNHRAKKYIEARDYEIVRETA